MVAAVTTGVLAGGCTDPYHNSAAPRCNKVDTLVLMAQSVPTAELVPCIDALPAGWNFGEMDIRSGRSTFTLDSDRAGLSAVRVTLARGCDIARGTEVPSDEVDDDIEVRRVERIDSLMDRYRGTRSYLFPGGCVTYRFSFAQRGTALVNDVSLAVGFTTRARLAEEVERSSGGRLQL